MFANQATLIGPFDCHANNTGAAWPDYLERVEQIFDANEVRADKGKQRYATLYVLGGKELKTLPVDETAETPPTTTPATVYNEYDKAIIRLNQYFNPKRNTVVEQYTFGEVKQKSDETIGQYVTRLRMLAVFCEFANKDKEIVRQVISHCSSSALRRTFLLELGRVHDTLDSHVEIVEGKKTTLEHDSVNLVKRNSDKTYQSSKSGTNSDNSGRKCYSCGGVFPYPEGRESCPAFDKSCNVCDMRGHFAKCCRSQAKNEGNKANQVGHIETTPVDDTEYIYSIGYREGDETPTTNVTLCGTELSICIDTGASVNVLDEYGFKALKYKPSLSRNKKRLFEYASSTPLPVIGMFTATVRSNFKVVETEFHVVRGNHGRSLCYKTSKALNLVMFTTAVDNKPKLDAIVEREKAKSVCESRKQNLSEKPANTFF